MADVSITPSRTIHQRPLDSVVSSRAFPCKRCGQKFTRKSILQDHLNVHDNKKPYACEHLLCIMAFARKSDMRRHYATHTGAGKMFCAQCEHWFSRKDVYLDHKCNPTSHRKQRKIQRDALPIEAPEEQHKQEAEMLMLPTLGFNDKDVQIQPIDVHYPILPMDQHHRSDKKQQVEVLDELWPFPSDTPDTAHDRFISFQAELVEELRDPVQFENPLQRVFQPISTNGDLGVPNESATLPWTSEPLLSAENDLDQAQIRRPTTNQTTSIPILYEKTQPVLPLFRASNKHDRELQCFMCDRKHLTTKEFKDHFAQHQRDCDNPHRYTCSECEVGFHHHFELAAHREAVQQIQTGSGKCNSCGTAFGEIGVNSHQAFGRHLRGNDNGLGVFGICYRKRIAQDQELAKQIRDQLRKVSHNPLVRVSSKAVRRVHFCQ